MYCNALYLRDTMGHFKFGLKNVFFSRTRKLTVYKFFFWDYNPLLYAQVISLKLRTALYWITFFCWGEGRDLHGLSPSSFRVKPNFWAITVQNAFPPPSSSEGCKQRSLGLATPDCRTFKGLYLTGDQRFLLKEFITQTNTLQLAFQTGFRSQII